MNRMEDVVRYFYEVSPERRNRDMRWVLSSATVRAIAAASGVPLDPDEPIPEGGTLMGCPIRIDESVQGLAHEFTGADGQFVWISRPRVDV